MGTTCTGTSICPAIATLHRRRRPRQRRRRTGWSIPPC